MLEQRALVYDMNATRRREAKSTHFAYHVDRQAVQGKYEQNLATYALLLSQICVVQPSRSRCLQLDRTLLLEQCVFPTHLLGAARIAYPLNIGGHESRPCHCAALRRCNRALTGNLHIYLT